jgi:hypothetical protein
MSGKEFTAYVTYGMSKADALRAGTVNAAQLLGIDDIGRLAPARSPTSSRWPAIRSTTSASSRTSASS